MSDFLPEAVRRGLDDARVAMLRTAGRLCVHDGDAVHKVSRIGDGGFSIVATEAPHLRGFVDLYDGPRHVAQCLVVASRVDGDLMVYEYKRVTQVSDRAPLDFAPQVPRPAGLIPLL